MTEGDPMNRSWQWATAGEQRITIRPAGAADFSRWSVLWQGYVDFYRATVSEDMTQATWSRCLSEAWPMECLVAEVENTLAGFAIVVVHPGTWRRQPVAYMEDLFVHPSMRRRGIGRALIKALEVRGRQVGWSCLYWQTKADNTAAQALYDQLGKRTDWVRYDLEIPV